VRDGVAGSCQPNGFCAFPDPTCPSMLRYGEASDGLENTCVSDGAALVPSNGVDAGLADETSVPIQISSTVTLDTDTGAISGGLTRGAGEGVASDIGYHQRMSGTAPLGVFVFASLEVTEAGTMRFIGSRAAVLLIGGEATISGVIDVAAGCDGLRSCPGPGGRAGAIPGTPASGCGSAGDGGSGASNTDGGGGGGGGAAMGATGGAAGSAATGAGGAICPSSPTLVPLVGGGGGGAGGQGATPAVSDGGGGGGAVQITSLTRLIVDGVVDANGAGGGGGPLSASGINAGAGSGGGAGGGVLLEAPSIELAASTVLVANGGGGGAGGYGDQAGTPGANGGRSTTVAAGGAAVGGNAPGGDGGAGSTAAQSPPTTGGNGGGGGGAVGRIALLTAVPVTLLGTLSPPPATGAVATR
jgi:hypothetical protein